MPLFESSPDEFELGRPVKRTIEWGKYRDFPNENPIFKYLLDKSTSFGDALEKLLETGIESPITEEQEENMNKLFSTPGFSNFHWFVASLLLNSHFFRLQPKAVRKIWFFTVLLGEENQRPGGYTLPDIEKFAGIKRKNRTLARYYTERLIDLGILKKVNPGRSYTRYQLSDKGSDKMDSYWELSDILFKLRNTIDKISSIIGSKKDWKSWLDESEQENDVGIADTRFGKIIFTNTVNKKVAEFIDLSYRWVSILLSVISTNAQGDEDFLKLIKKSGLTEEVDRFRRDYLKEGEKFSIEKDSEGAYLLVDLRDIREDFSLSRYLDNPLNPLLEEFNRYPIPVGYYFKRK